MVEKLTNIKDLINETIDASIEFEKKMDQTDFDSWLDGDNSDELEKSEQDPTPYKEFTNNITDLRNICKEMKGKGNEKSSKKNDNYSLEKQILDKLFESKFIRIEARNCSKKEDSETKYNEALYPLVSALNQLQLTKKNNFDKKWLILIYNDLSICYAGLENSSLSRGFAEEAREIIEKEKKNKEFKRKSRLYNLYTTALFNQAQAEKRSYLNAYAEKNFRKIIDYVKSNNHLLNFNYYSALLNLGDLYIDLSRGREAIEFLDKVLDELDKEKENDIRYWNASIAKINALIDQSEYADAKEELNKNIFKNVDDFELNKRHKITSTGFKGLNCLVRRTIEEIRNELKMTDKRKEHELNKVKKKLDDNKDIMNIMRERKQEGLTTKVHKQLSDIYQLLIQFKEDKSIKSKYDKRIIKKYDKKVIEHLLVFISEKEEINDLDVFIQNKKMCYWIDRCDDLDILESFTNRIIKVIKNKTNKSRNKYEILINKYKKLLEKIEEKISKECEDKDQLLRAERIVKKINEFKEAEEYNEFNKFLNNIKLSNNISQNDNIKKLSNKEIYKRLDINEKEFDNVLYKRFNKIEENHIAEVIILKRWNSFSPGLFREFSGSLGGGYLIRINRKKLGQDDEKENWEENVTNIVIDPGYNFIQNFRSEGFYINDIDTIIITHSHLDHCAELLPVMDLIYQFNKRYKDTSNKERKRKKINLCLSQGAYKKFSTYIDDPDWKKQLKDVIILENLKEVKCDPFNILTIVPISTPHMDLGGAHSIGLKIEIIGGEKKLSLGFTGDTPWDPKIKKAFKGCDSICIHMGSIKYEEIGYTPDRYNLVKKDSRKMEGTLFFDELRKTYNKSNHLLFFGTLDFIECCADKDEPLVIVGEFGEELKYGLRIDLCKKLRSEANKKRNEKNKIVCLPGDIGLYIGIEEDGKKKVRCNFCEHFVKPEEIETFSYGREDAIHHICKTCGNTLTDLQKQAVIEHRVTRH